MRKLFLLLLLPLYSFAQDQQLEKFIDSLVGPMNKPDVPGTMILVAQDGKMLFQKAYGLANLELSVPLKTDHAFAIGSVTKQFTAVAILQLAEQGKLKLSDDLRKYFPDFNTHAYTITIDNLLSHTSGITMTDKDYNTMHAENKAAIHPALFFDYVMKAKPLFTPGTEWSYNNYAYIILANLVERISGERFEDYLKGHIFKPAGMTHSFLGDDLQPLKNVVASYGRGYQGNWRNLYRQSEWDYVSGAGGIISTMADMMQWDIALREGKVLSKEWLEKAWTPYVLKNGDRVNYGYAWDVNTYDGLRIISHSGGIYGFATQSVHVPEKKLYVFFADFYASDPNTIPKKILARLLDLPRWGPVPKGETKLSDYTGSYQLHHLGSRLITRITDKPLYAKFIVSGDTLYVQQPLAERTFLRPAGKDRFIPGRSEENVYVFNRDAKGNVVSMNMIPFLFGGQNALRPNKKVIVADKPPVVIVTVDSVLLKKYAGTYYRSETDEYFFITAQGNKLYGSIWNAPPRFELLPVSSNQFVRKGVEDYNVSFKNDSKGFPMLTISGHSSRDYKKVAD